MMTTHTLLKNNFNEQNEQSFFHSFQYFYYSRTMLKMLHPVEKSHSRFLKSSTGRNQVHHSSKKFYRIT